MVQLMVENMMRRDGVKHQGSRRKIFPSFSPGTVLEVWRAEFEGSRRAVIEGLKKKQVFDLVRDFGMLVSGAALVAITGLR